MLGKQTSKMGLRAGISLSRTATTYKSCGGLVIVSILSLNFTIGYTIWKRNFSESLQGTISKYLSPNNQKPNTKTRVAQKYKIDDLKNVRSGFISPNQSHSRGSVNSLHWSTIKSTALILHLYLYIFYWTCLYSLRLKYQVFFKWQQRIIAQFRYETT